MNHADWTFSSRQPYIPAMEFHYSTYRIRLKHTFTIARSSHDFYDIVYVSKITAVFAIIEHFNWFVCKNSFCKQEKCHIRPSPRPINCKETKTCCGQTIEVTVGVGHQFI